VRRSAPVSLRKSVALARTDVTTGLRSSPHRREPQLLANNPAAPTLTQRANGNRLVHDRPAGRDQQRRTRERHPWQAPLGKGRRKRTVRLPGGWRRPMSGRPRCSRRAQPWRKSMPSDRSGLDETWPLRTSIARLLGLARPRCGLAKQPIGLARRHSEFANDPCLRTEAASVGRLRDGSRLESLGGRWARLFCWNSAPSAEELAFGERWPLREFPRRSGGRAPVATQSARSLPSARSFSSKAPTRSPFFCGEQDRQTSGRSLARPPVVSLSVDARVRGEASRSSCRRHPLVLSYFSEGAIIGAHTCRTWPVGRERGGTRAVD
jgi:hypothetical protein